MTPVLVVEDLEHEMSTLQYFVVQAGYDCLPVKYGPDLFDQLRQSKGSAVLVGSVPVGLDAPTLFTSLRQFVPSVPIVALTGCVATRASEAGQHRETTSGEAISSGIAGCLPRGSLATDLEWTLKTILSSHDCRDRNAETEAICYTIDNKPQLLPLLVAQVRCRLEKWPFADPMEPTRVAVALSEVLDNALYHGNLELNSELRQGDGRAWRDESRRRNCLPPYCDRRIRFQGVLNLDSARFTIRDEGPGFNPLRLSDCTERENLERCSGRGLLLMRMYMDEVRFNATGNEAVLVKHHPQSECHRSHPLAER